MKTVDMNKLSKWGLIYKINKEVLHPLGLALSRDPDSGISEGCFIDSSDDLYWEYSDDLIKSNEEKLQYFLDNRVEILTKINKEEK